MLFTANVVVTTDHKVDNKKEQLLKIAHGIIRLQSVIMPKGCHGLVHCVILHHEHQIAPSTEAMDLHGDAPPIDWEEYYESYQPPYELKLKGWNEDDTYPHTFDVYVAILPRKAILALAIVDAVKSLFGMFSPKRIFTAKE